MKEHYIGRQLKVKDLWHGMDNEDVHDIKIVDIEAHGEFVDLILDKPVLIDRDSDIENEFRWVSGYSEATFTEIGMMEVGKIRFAIYGW